MKKMFMTLASVAALAIASTPAMAQDTRYSSHYTRESEGVNFYVYTVDNGRIRQFVCEARAVRYEQLVTEVFCVDGHSRRQTFSSRTELYLSHGCPLDRKFRCADPSQD